MPAILSALFSRSSQPNRAHTPGGRPAAPTTTPSGPDALWHGVGGAGARVAGFGPWPDKQKRAGAQARQRGHIRSILGAERRAGVRAGRGRSKHAAPVSGADRGARARSGPAVADRAAAA